VYKQEFEHQISYTKFSQKKIFYPKIRDFSITTSIFFVPDIFATGSNDCLPFFDSRFALYLFINSVRDFAFD